MYGIVNDNNLLPGNHLLNFERKMKIFAYHFTIARIYPIAPQSSLRVYIVRGF